jgi:hypothetical protein
MLCTPQQILFGDQIEKTEMGRAYRTYGEEESFVEET